MTEQELKRLTEQNQLPSVLLFEGENDYFKQEAWQSLRRRFLPSGLEELNETVLDAPEADDVIAAAETLPLMADRRLVLIRDLPGLTGRSEADDRLTEYLCGHPPETALLVLYCTQKPDGRKKLYSAIKKAGGVVTFSPLRDRELTSFVTGTFHSLGTECDERTADYLIFTSGSDVQTLVNEMNKLAAHAGDRGRILPEDIQALATPSTESTVFQMIDAIVAGQQARAFQLLKAQRLAGTDQMAVLSLLLRQFRLLQHIKVMQYEKRDRNFIRSSLGLPSFAVDQYIRQASAYTGSQVKNALQLCLDADYAIKSGRMSMEGAAEAIVLKLFSVRDRDGRS